MKLRNILFYGIVIGGLSFFGYWIVLQGQALENQHIVYNVATEGSAWGHFIDSIQENIGHPFAILLFQIIAIILAARAFGFFFRKIGQPSVIGEIIAGIVLGPSLLGYYFPDFSTFLFPESSLPNLGVMSQVGLVLFMFVVGMELDLKLLKNQAHEAVVISHASIIFPFSLGIGLAYFIYQQTAPPEISFLSYALFIGISMSITAFPVLARIVQERGITKTKLGSIVITCAAADDITAWCLLAAVIAVVKAGSLASAGYTLVFAIAYVVLMLRFVRPFLQRIGELHATQERLTKPVVGLFFVTLLVSAWSTEVIGIHALFGAFMAGVIMPPNISFRNIFIEKVEDVALVLLLPLFFVFTGLRTQIGLLNEPGLWKLCIIIIAVAVIGKFVGSAIAARFVGQSWYDSLTIGALMNTRGLMELVALNIGYDLGVLTPEMFAIFVLMALVTTFMTGPSLDLINRFLKPGGGRASLLSKKDKYNILISFGNPHTGKLLLRIVNLLTRKSLDNSTVTALHLSPGNELNQFNSVEYEKENFALLEEEGKSLRQPFISVFKPTDDIDEEIAKISNSNDYDLLLVGLGQSVFDGTVLGRILGFTTKVINPERIYETLTGRNNLFSSAYLDERTKNMVKSVQIPMGILIDKGLERYDNLIVPIYSLSDSFLLVYIQKFIQNGGLHITLLDMEGVIKSHAEFKEAVRAIEYAAPNHVNLVYEPEIDTIRLKSFDLMLVSLPVWKQLVLEKHNWLKNMPSTLIFRS